MKKIVLSLLLVICVQLANAQDPGFPGGDPDVPIDGELCFILFAMMGYGVWSIRKEQKRGNF